MRGAEHQVDGETFMCELHFVHINIKYDTIAEAAVQSDGLAVLGVIFEDVGTSDPFLKVSKVFCALHVEIVYYSRKTDGIFGWETGFCGLETSSTVG